MGASRKCLYAFAGYVGVKSLSPKFRIQRLHRILEQIPLASCHYHLLCRQHPTDTTHLTADVRLGDLRIASCHVRIRHRDGSAPRIPALRIAEKSPMKLRLVDVFAAVQAEDRNGTPGQKGRRGEYGDVAVGRGGIEILLAESPAGLQSGIWSLRGIYSGRRLWRQRL